MKLYLLIAEQGLSIFIDGPYESEKERGISAREWRHEHGGNMVWGLDVLDDGTPEPFDYSGKFFERSEA